MKKVLYVFVLMISVLSFPFASIAVAKNTIKGIITDAVSDQPLPGANVFLEGTAFGAATDISGYYKILGVPKGNYSLHVNYIGYLEKVMPIELMEGEDRIVHVKLEAGIIEGEVITVTAQAEGQAAAINQQLQSNTIKSIVSAERIQELPDANAAESVGRLPGVSIKRDGGEANKVVIRGLSPTYNSVTIAGERIPATDLSDRSVDMSMISPEMLAGIEVTKALTADRDADAFGGSVDFKLNDARDGGFYYDARYQGGYNRQFDDFGNYKGSFILSNRFIDEKLGLMVTGNLEKTQRGSDEFNADYYRIHEQREEEEELLFAIGDLVLVDRSEVRKRYGGSLILDYRIPSGKLAFTNFLSRLDKDELRRDNKYNEDSNWHERRLRERQTQIDILTNSFSGEIDYPFAKIDWRFSRSESLQRRPYENYIRFKETGAFDRALIPLVATPQNLIDAAYNDLMKTNLYQGQFFTEKAWERDLTGQINFEIPYNFGANVAGYVKFGGKYRSKMRERDRNHATRRLDDDRPEYEKYHTRSGDPDFEFITVPGVGWASFVNYIDGDYDQGNFLDGDYDFGPAPDGNELGHLLDVFMLDSIYRFSPYADMEDYNLDEDVSAGYLMTEIRLGRYLMFMPGIRYEHTRADMTGRKGSIVSTDYEPELDEAVISDTTAKSDYGNWFPMFHLRVKPLSWFDVRLAYTKTLSRPRLDWLLPKWRYIGTQSRLDMGRPDLKPQIAANYDLFLSFYGGWVGLFTLGGFYKEIDDLIYLREGRMILTEEDAIALGSINLKGSKLDRPENNPFQTTIKGFEIEWQTNFRWLPNLLSGLVLYANFAHIWSETKFPQSFNKIEEIPYPPFIISTQIDTFRVGTMPDQADDIVNLAIGYDLGGFSARLSMLYQGRTLNTVGEREEYDSYIQDYLRWDLSVKQQITRHLGVYLHLNNISDRPDESFLRDSNHPTSIQYYGWTAALGIRLHN